MRRNSTQNQAKTTIRPHSLQTKSKLQLRNSEAIEVQKSPMYIYIYIYIGFKTLFYIVRQLASIASYLPNGLHLGDRPFSRAFV
jgi:hypothetical protein